MSSSKIMTCKGTLRQVFIRVYKTGEPVRRFGIFDPALWTVDTLTFSLVQLSPLPPFPFYFVGGGGGYGILGLRQINTCSEVPLQVNFEMMTFCSAFYESYLLWYRMYHTVSLHYLFQQGWTVLHVAARHSKSQTVRWVMGICNIECNLKNLCKSTRNGFSWHFTTVLCPSRCPLILAIYGTMIYTVPYIILLIRVNPLQGRERGLDPGNRDFLGPCEMASISQASSICGPKRWIFPGLNPLPLAQVMDLLASKALCTGPCQSDPIGSFMYMSSHRWHELPGPSAVNFSYWTGPPLPHLITALNSGQCSKVKSQNLLEINRKL